VIKLLILFLFCHVAWGKVSLEFKTNQPSVNQGEIIEGTLALIEGTVPSMNLRGKNIAKGVYILNIEPFMGKAESFEAKTKLIFLKVPETNMAMETLNGEEVIILWKDLEIKPTEAAQSFLLGDFEIPDRKKLMPWILGFIFLVLLALVFWYFKTANKHKNLSKQQRKMLKDQLLHASSYEDVVLIWNNKHQTLKEFPTFDTPFKNLEVTLFKYQFKPQRSASEVEQVMEAYRKFRDEIQKGQDGI
jgi:cbb3-type cytochrome oxidase subunit 3